MPHADDNGLRIHYVDTDPSGAPGGTALVLIHGFPLNGRLWRAQQEALGDRHRILLPDLIGFGGSDAPEDPSSYSMERFASNVLAVMDHAGVERAAVGGLSMGGYVALELWRRARDRISALILADTRAEADDEGARAKRTEQQERLRRDERDALIEDLLRALLAPATHERKPDVVDETRSLMDNPAAGWIGALEAMKTRLDSTADLTSIDVPTLIVVGEHDALTPPAVARSLHERISGSQLVVVPDAGHFSCLESPAVFSGALADFLASA